MEDNNTTFLNNLLAEGSVQEMVRNMVQKEINHIMQNELSTFLGYEKGDSVGRGSGNNRNGEYHRRIKTTFGELDVAIPRDRNGEFVQHTIPRYDRSASDIIEVITELYCYGNTVRDISGLISKLYGEYYSPATISEVTKSLDHQAELFHTRAFIEPYAFIFMDATYLNLRRDSVGKEALHVILGITTEGKKEVLDAQIFPTESANNYEEMLLDLKERGLTGVLLFISDGLIGMEDMVHRVFPKAEHQNCWVHLLRNVAHQVREKDRIDILSSLKQVYTARDEEGAKTALESFLDKYEHAYPRLRTVFMNKTNLFSFYHYPESIRKTIYTTNPIESNNKWLKRKLSPKEQFPNEASLDRFISVRYQAYNKKMSDFVHQGFRTASYELNELVRRRYELES